MTVVSRVARIVSAVVVAAGVAVGGFALGHGDGYRDGEQTGQHQGYERAVSELPLCDEDQVLYPVADYRGAGEALPGEYECLYIEEW